MKHFFILGMGRSGTAFLASLLSKANHALVYHEPEPEDRLYFGLRYAGHFDAVVDNYLKRRFQKILPKDKSIQHYGEVNSYLRYEVDWLRDKFDPAIIHVVRDGRDFVSSAYPRVAYTVNDKKMTIVPKSGDAYAEKWQNMSRFEKLCWYWMHTNEFLASKTDKRVQFEKLIGDYEYFEKNLLNQIGLYISKNLWEEQIQKPKNTTKHFLMKKRIKRLLGMRKQDDNTIPIAHWNKWDNERLSQFDDICSGTMKKLGYYSVANRP
ncbi:conserved hypothetical protein [delta proteobacterium NaphS2]|nr:conserved hypothetical protein [delta proteobacterium NaphS2]